MSESRQELHWTIVARARMKLWIKVYAAAAMSNSTRNACKYADEACSDFDERYPYKVD